LNRKEYENVTAELAEDAKGLIRDSRLDILQLFSALLAAFAELLKNNLLRLPWAKDEQCPFRYNVRYEFSLFGL